MIAVIILLSMLTGAFAFYLGYMSGYISGRQSGYAKALKIIKASRSK